MRLREKKDEQKFWTQEGRKLKGKEATCIMGSNAVSLFFTIYYQGD